MTILSALTSARPTPASPSWRYVVRPSSLFIAMTHVTSLTNRGAGRGQHDTPCVVAPCCWLSRAINTSTAQRCVWLRGVAMGGGSGCPPIPFARDRCSARRSRDVPPVPCADPPYSHPPLAPPPPPIVNPAVTPAPFDIRPSTSPGCDLLTHLHPHLPTRSPLHRHLSPSPLPRSALQPPPRPPPP